MTSKLTRERLFEIAEDGFLKHGESKELARMALAAMDRDKVRNEHAEWSQETFGNVGPVGALKHLSKEALEAAAEPDDLSEWADMQFLLWDAQRRAGITDEQITQAMIDKLAVNKQREWPEPKDGEPRLHIKEQPAPAFPDFDNVLESLDYEVRCNAWESEHVLKACQATYDACRAAMLQELQKSAGAEATCRSNKNVQVLHTKSPAQSDCCPAQNCIHSAQGVDRPVAWHHTAKSKEENHSNCCFSYSPSHDFGPRYEKPQSQPHYLPERLDYDRALHFLSTEPRKVTPETVIGGNSPVIPDGWTCNDKANAALMMLDRIETADPVDDDRIDGIKRIVRELVAAKQPQNAPQNIPEIIPGWIPVSEQKPDCWCLTCRPVTLNDMRFVVCPDCGNKRCPRANDHRNACTGSNEPGQEGSAYPAAPQEVRGE